MRVNHAKTGKMDTPYTGPFTVMQILKEGYMLRHDNGEFLNNRVAPSELKVIIQKPKYINTKPEKILAHSQDETSDIPMMFYLVKWTNYPLLDATWITRQDFSTYQATALLDKYENTRSGNLSSGRGDMSAHNYISS